MPIRRSPKRSAPNRGRVARKPRKTPLDKFPPPFSLTPEQETNPISRAFWLGVQLGPVLNELNRIRPKKGRPQAQPGLADQCERILDLVSDLPPTTPERTIRDRLRPAFPGIENLQELPPLGTAAKDFAVTLLALLYPARSKSHDARVDAILRTIARERKKGLRKVTEGYRRLGVQRGPRGPVIAEEYLRVAGALISQALQNEDFAQIPVLQELARYLTVHFPLSREA